MSCPSWSVTSNLESKLVTGTDPFSIRITERPSHNILINTHTPTHSLSEITNFMHDKINTKKMVIDMN